MTNKTREKFNKTKLVTMGGACFECCDYEGIVEDMQKFIETVIIKQAVKVALKTRPAPRVSWSETTNNKDFFNRGFNQALDLWTKNIKEYDKQN